MDFSQDLVRGSIVPLVLALLDERTMYGYEIVKVVNVRTNGRFQWKEGTLYPTLHRLETDGYLRAKWQPKAQHTGGGGMRKYYAITRKGRTELARRRTEWKQFAQAVNGVLYGV